MYSIGSAVFIAIWVYSCIWERHYPADEDLAFDEGSGIEFPDLNETLVEDLVILGKVWGFIKYHHPEVGRGNYNWDAELFRLLPQYIKVEHPDQRDQLLLQWIDSYGKIDSCKRCPKSSSKSFLNPDHQWLEKSAMDVKLKNKLREIYRNRYLGKHYYIEMNGKVGNPVFTKERPYSHMPFPDAGFRLLSIYRYWNMIQYYFPYRHLTDIAWEEVLRKHIPRLLNAENELQYELAVLQLIGEVRDTHANLWGGGDQIREWKGNYFPPFQLRYIEKKAVVYEYFNDSYKEKAGLEVGDVILSVNDQRTQDLIDSLKGYYPASNATAQRRNFMPDLLRSQTDSVRIQFLSNGDTIETWMSLYHTDSIDRYSGFQSKKGKSFKFLEDKIGYINLGSIQTEDIQKIRSEFKDARGIIIDIRNYPGSFVPFSLGSFFVSSSTPFVKFTKGSTKNPGEFVFSEPLYIKPTNSTYEGKVVVLVNEYTQSQGEYTAMAFQAGMNTTVLGSTTAGADGNVSEILLPGGLRTMISGIGVYYPDGTETQRVGVIPDIAVEPTIEGIQSGRDEYIEKAIQYINE